MALTALIDTGFWISLFEKDKTSSEAEAILSLLIEARYEFILPWPTLYEFLNSRFFRRKEWIKKFQRICDNSNALKLSDSDYREAAYYSLFNVPHRCRDQSLTDLVIKEMLKDVNIKISALITFNAPDFAEICQKRKIELHPGF